jgi:hypothetical protein
MQEFIFQAIGLSVGSLALGWGMGSVICRLFFKDDGFND